MDTFFYVVTKALWAIARPETLLLLALLAGTLALLRGRRRLGAGLSLGALALCVLIGAAPVHNLLLRPLETRFPAGPNLHELEGIIVLGGAEAVFETQDWGAPQLNDAADRYLAAIALARAHPAAVVLFAGGGAQLSPQGEEAEIARRILVAAGVAPERILLENRSRNTVENARKARALAPEALTGEWALVTSAFHMPRAVGTFCAAGWRRITAWPTDFRSAPWRPHWAFAENLQHLNTGAREWLGLVGYRATGRSAALFPDGCR